MIDFYNEVSDSVKNNHVKSFNDNKLTKMDGCIVNRGPSSDNELARKKPLMTL